MNVSDVMRRSFAMIRPEASLLDAAHSLLETNQRGLPASVFVLVDLTTRTARQVPDRQSWRLRLS